MSGFFHLLRNHPLRVGLTVALALAGLSGCRVQKFQGIDDAGTICTGNDHLVNGECRFVCSRDGDCAAGERCNLFVGQCEAKPPAPDAGPAQTPCTSGAERCTADKLGIERCADAGTWATYEVCPPPTGYCLNEKCLLCQPGASACVPGQPTQLLSCNDLGTVNRTVTCTGSATCQGGECRECSPNSYRCSPDGKSLQQCARSADETLTWHWVNAGDNFDGTCITQQCQNGGPNGVQCKTPDCFPGQARCVDTKTKQDCTAQGAWDAGVVCPGATSECQGGTCIDECADAVAAKSYFGCDFWTAVQDNSVDPLFKGGTVSGQGAANAISEFAFVIANRSSLPATVTVTRVYQGQLQVVATKEVPGRLDPATKGVAQIRVPWQSIGTKASGDTYTSISGIARYGYRLSSTKPLTVYQFSPLKAALSVPGDLPGGIPCSSSLGSDYCYGATGNQAALCSGGTCKCGGSNCPTMYAFSNDASLLLPAHILDRDYVAMAPEHAVGRLSPSLPAQADPFFNGHITIVATQDNTVVTVRSNAVTRAGNGVAALAKGGTGTYTLQAYDVLQIASGNPTATPPASDLECGLSDFGSSYVCRIDNELTGSIVTADKPIAVFGGSACYVRGATNAACDHVEEQLFPFSTWGKNFVATRTNPYRLTNGSFAAPANAGPDYYQVVAGCPATNPLCPSGGTLVTFSQPPAAGDVLPPNRCVSGSIAANTCRLAAGSFMEFRSKSSFTISADAPISVGQFFSSESATTGLVAPDTGDPSFVLLPPVEQWRTNYTVLTAPGTRDNFIGLVIDDSKVQTVQIDGLPVAGFQPIAGTSTIVGATFKVLNVPVSVGTHTINIVPKPNQNPLPGAGVTVYGADSYVSYGYTGGLDLSTIVTGITPGG